MSTRTERVLLLLAVSSMTDMDDVLSWRVAGLVVTPAQVRLLHAITVEDALDVNTLHRLDLELGCWS